MWIKVLEGHYMTLFKSPDYLDSLVRTLGTAQDYKMAQHQMLADILQVLPIPTNKDMDELYKEIYLLKKKVKELSSSMENQKNSA
jgi:polyhydroxyalkanoate synthesis regulator phasin